MKKLILVIIVIAAIGAVGYVVYDKSIPESKKIRAEISRTLHDKDKSMFIILMDVASLRRKLADAYNDEGRPDDAIDILMELIKENGKPHYNIYGQQMPRMSFYYLEDSYYYESLARSFELKGDAISRDKALKKRDHNRTISDQLSTRENNQKHKETARERAAILN